MAAVSRFKSASCFFAHRSLASGGFGAGFRGFSSDSNAKYKVAVTYNVPYRDASHHRCVLDIYYPSSHVRPPIGEFARQWLARLAKPVSQPSLACAGGLEYALQQQQQPHQQQTQQQRGYYFNYRDRYRDPNRDREVADLMALASSAGVLGGANDGFASHSLLSSSSSSSSSDDTTVDSFSNPNLSPWGAIEHSNSSKRFPVVLFVHGGAWIAGHRNLPPWFPHSWLANVLVPMGFVVVVPTYRLAPWSQHPVAVHDVAHALHWIYHHIQRFRGDASRLTLMGHSAGGHIAGMLAFAPHLFLSELAVPLDVVKAFVSVCGVLDVSILADAFPRLTKLLLPVVFGHDRANWHFSSPLHYAMNPPPNALLPPPSLLINAQFLDYRLQRGTLKMEEALKKRGAHVQTHTVKASSHFTVLSWPPTSRRLIRRVIAPFIGEADAIQKLQLQKASSSSSSSSSSS